MKVGINSQLRVWILPIVATAGLVLLFGRKSGDPVVLNRYTIDYTILLILAAVNVSLVWWHAKSRGSFVSRLRGLWPRQLVPLGVLVIAILVLIDFVKGSRSPADWVNILLLTGILLQVEARRERPTFVTTYFAVGAYSLVLGVIVLEVVLVGLWVERVIPRNEREFLQLMSFEPEAAITRQLLRFPHQSDIAWQEPIPLRKSVGTFRILGLSDSFGLAGGRSSNYHYLLEGILRRDVASAIQMINISVGGYETGDQLTILPFGMAYAPDLVLHGFFVGNDFNVVTNAKYVYQSIPIWPGAVRYRPYHFFIRNWLENLRVVVREAQERQREVMTGVVNKEGSFSKTHFLKMQFRRMDLWGKRSEENVKRLKEVLPVLDAIRSAVEKAGARYVMVVHPDETQVNGDLRREILKAFQLDEDEYDFELPQKLLGSYCAEKQIMCLDLLPAFRAAAVHDNLYLLRDTHYNHKGNELAAVMISKFLVDTGNVRR